MFSPTLVLLTRALRVDSRSLWSHLLRLFLLLLILFELAIAQQTSAFFGAPGLRFFQSMCWTNLLFITLAGISYFASAITEEKEELTLGLLKMAGVNRLSLLLGKSVPRQISAILLLSAQFPFTLLAITLGGVTSQQVFAAYCSQLAYLVMLANLGLLCSVVAKRSRGAAWMTGVMLGLFLLLGTFMVRLVLRVDFLNTSMPSAGYFVGFMNGIQQASPFNRMNTILSTGFAESALSFQVISNLAAGAVFFGLAWAVFDLFARDELPVAPATGFLFRRRLSSGAMSCGRAWGNPLIWKSFHFTTGGRPMFVGKLALYGLLIGLVLYLSRWGTYGGPEVLGGVIMGCMSVALLVEPALYISRVFYDEAKWKTLSSIMLLPWSLPELVYSQLAGCAMALVPAAAWFGLGALIYPKGLGDGLDGMLTHFSGWYTILQYVLFLHVTAFLSLLVKWGALPLALVLVYVVNGCCLGMLALSNTYRGGEEFMIFPGLVSLFAIVVLQFSIAHKLRAVAAE